MPLIMMKFIRHSGSTDSIVIYRQANRLTDRYDIPPQVCSSSEEADQSSDYKEDLHIVHNEPSQELADRLT